MKKIKASHFFSYTAGLGLVLIGLKLCMGMAGTIIITLICSALIIAYGKILTKTKFCLSLPTDQIGDNSYYLGFIFTIFSLIMAMFSLYKSADEPEKLIGYFAVGLFTTLVGVACRCYYSSSESSGSSMFYGYTGALDNTMLGIVEKFALQIDKYNLSFSAIIDEMTKSEKEIHKTSKNFVEHLTGVSEKMEDVTSKLQVNFDTLEKSVTETFETSKKEMTEFADGLVHLKNEISGIEHFKDHIDAFNTAMPLLVKNVETLQVNYTTLTNHQEEMNKNVENFNQEFIKNLQTTRNNFKSITETTSSLLSTAIKELNSDNETNKTETRISYHYPPYDDRLFD